MTLWYVHIIKVWNFSDTHSGVTGESFHKNLLIKSLNQHIFEKLFKLNRNLPTIPFNMMYNMSLLRHRFSDDRWGRGGGGGALNHLHLLLCKSVYYQGVLGPRHTLAHFFLRGWITVIQVVSCGLIDMKNLLIQLLSGRQILFTVSYF